MGRDGEARWVVAFATLLMCTWQAAGQQPCTTLASSLYLCFPYVQAGNSTKVGSDCCTPLKSIVDTRPDCLCTLQNLTSSVPNVNVTRAYALATLCNIVSSATLSCNGTSSPAPAPSRNSAVTINRASMFDVALVGLPLLVYFLNQ